MTTKTDGQDVLRPYKFHGLSLKISGDEASTKCPFCDREGKFNINTGSGLYRCVVCNEGSKKGGGNALTFLNKLHAQSLKDTSNHKKKEIESLANNRGIFDTSTLLSWGVCFSTITGIPIIPAYNQDLKLNQVYKYASPEPGKKPILMATATLGQGLFGLNLFDPKKPFIYLCEGLWDAMIIWEVLSCTRLTLDDEGKPKYLYTSNAEKALINKCNVIGVPGCGTFSEKWVELFKGKDVFICYDNDHPKVVKDEEKDPASIVGIRRVVGFMSKPGSTPKSIRYLEWGPGGFTKDLPHGYDIRDHFKDEVTMTQRVKKFADIRQRMKVIPANWVEGRSIESHKKGSPTIESKECQSWKQLKKACIKAMKWTKDLDVAFSVMLACSMSTKVLGDQLWVKIVGPASCGKSTLCEALAVNQEFTISKSTIRGFHSGYKSDSTGEEDNSLISIVDGKTLLVKDGDTILKSPNLPQILSEARDIYDRVSRVHYRNKISRDYDHICMTWILCGTSALQALDNSDLGERFLTCRIMETINEEEEEAILIRQSHKAWTAMNYESNGEVASRYSPEQLEFMQLTGGYLGYLRSNATDLLKAVQASEESLHYCTRLAKFVSYMRARPSKSQDELVERELAARLTGQLIRLGRFLCAVLNKNEFDSEVLKKVKKVALDTCKGKTLDIAEWLYKEGAKGVELRTIAIWINETDDKTRTLLRFMRRIGALEVFQYKPGAGMLGRHKWRLSPQLHKLFDAIYE